MCIFHSLNSGVYVTQGPKHAFAKFNAIFGAQRALYEYVSLDSQTSHAHSGQFEMRVSSNANCVLAN